MPSIAHLPSGSASWVSAVYPLAAAVELITYMRCAAPAPGGEVDVIAAAVEHDLRCPHLAAAPGVGPHLAGRGRRELVGGRGLADGDAAVERLRGDVRAADPDHARIRRANALCRLGIVHRGQPSVAASARTRAPTAKRDFIMITCPPLLRFDAVAGGCRRHCRGHPGPSMVDKVHESALRERRVSGVGCQYIDNYQPALDRARN